MDFFAHSRENAPMTEWQTLRSHSKAVAELSEAFADSFASGKHGRLEGETHDTGKARSAFQSYLRRCNGVEDADLDFGDHSHSGAGACWLAQNAGGIGTALSYCIAGHHAGLPDWSASSKATMPPLLEPGKIAKENVFGNSTELKDYA